MEGYEGRVRMRVSGMGWDGREGVVGVEEV